MKKNLLSIFVSTLLFVLIVSADYTFYNSFVPVWSDGSNILKPVRAGNTVSYKRNNEAWLLIASGRDQNDAILKTVQRYNVNLDF